MLGGGGPPATGWGGGGGRPSREGGRGGGGGGGGRGRRPGSAGGWARGGGAWSGSWNARRQEPGRNDWTYHGLTEEEQMEQRTYRGSLTPDELADYLVAHFDPQEHLQAQKLGSGNSL